jgi:F-type H+-transporting ATPase subunit delta
MDTGRVSARYANALMGWAVEKNCSTETYLQTQDLLSYIVTNSDLRTLIGSNSILAKTKDAMILSFVRKFTPILEQYLLLLIQKNRVSNLYNSLLLFSNKYRKHFGLIRVDVTSASELSDNIKDGLGKHIAKHFGREPEMHYTVDNNIIGGFILQVENQELDKSIRGEINSIKKQFLAHR